MNYSDYNILVADDDTIFRSLLVTTLKREGYGIVEAGDGLAAVNALKAHKVDLILADLMMPKMTGMELVKYVRNTCPEIPVVIVTGYASLDTALDCIREGVYDFLTKPFQLDELKLTISNAIERVMILRENQRLLDELKVVHQRLMKLEKIKSECDNATREEIVQDQKIMEEGFDQLRSFQNQLLPFQYAPQKSGKKVRSQDLDVLDTLHANGTLSDSEYSRLRSRILEGA